MLLRGLRLADQAAENPGKGDSLLHGTAWGSRGKSLEMERKVVLDGSRGLDGLNLESGTDVGEGAGAKWQGLGVVCLPTLVLGAEIKCA